MTEIKKLEIKYIAPYLPYGLRWRFEGEDITHEVVGLDIINTGVKLISPYYNYGSCEINNGRPLLRPMSDLYKERNGKVGIVELAKIEHPCSIYHILRNKCVEVAGNNENSLSFRYDKDNNYFLNSNFDCDDEYYPIMYQLEVFEYLFANHYDVFGLIDQGLAINKNDIE